MNVGDIRKAIQDLPDNADISVEWENGPPRDSEPGVRIFGFAASDGKLSIGVGLFYLDEIVWEGDEEVEDEEEDDEETTSTTDEK